MKNFIKILFAIIFILFVNKVNALSTYTIKDTTVKVDTTIPFADETIYQSEQTYSIYKNNKEITKFNTKDITYVFSNFDKTNINVVNDNLYFTLTIDGADTRINSFFKTNLKTLKTEQLVATQRIFWNKNKYIITYIDYKKNIINIKNLLTNKDVSYVVKDANIIKDITSNSGLGDSLIFSDNSKKIAITFSDVYPGEDVINSSIYVFDIPTQKLKFFKKVNFVPTIKTWKTLSEPKVEKSK